VNMHEWLLWAFVLIGQNFAFTFVSRARNSGSLRRHVIAGIFSNGIWFVSQLIIFTAMFQMMVGKYGLKMQVFTAIYYTFWTLTGSVLAHVFSLKTEKGKAAVGANKKYAQITVEEWNAVKQHFFDDAKKEEQKVDQLLQIVGGRCAA
jgi:hypothetical protein